MGETLLRDIQDGRVVLCDNCMWRSEPTSSLRGESKRQRKEGRRCPRESIS